MGNQSFDDNLIALQNFGTKIQDTQKSKTSVFKLIENKKTSIKQKRFDFKIKKLVNWLIRYCRRPNWLTRSCLPKMGNIKLSSLSNKSKSKKLQSRFRLIETRKQRGNKTIIVRRRVRIRSLDQIPTRTTIQKTLIDDLSIQNKSLYNMQSRPSIWDIHIDHENEKPTFFDIFNERP